MPAEKWGLAVPGGDIRWVLTVPQPGAYNWGAFTATPPPPAPRLARSAATDSSWAPGPGRLGEPLTEKGVRGAPKC